MTRIIWRFTVDGTEHRFVFDHHPSTQQIGFLDGKQIFDDAIWHNLGNTHHFTLGDHACKVVVGRQYFVIVVEYELYVDNKLIPTDSERIYPFGPPAQEK